MVAIFTTSSILDQICHVDDYLAWKSMVIKLGEVYIDSEIDIPEDMEDPLFILDSAIKIDQSKREFIKSIVDDHQNVLKEPCGIYLLDISPEEANDIQTHYGVVCQSSISLSHDLITHKGMTAELIEGEQDKKWEDIFRKFKQTPTNSALIIDAHLFENDQYDEREGCYDTKYCNGISNLKEILEQILPSQFSDTYHVGVLVTNTDEAKTIKRSRTSLTNARIATAINKLKKKIIRPYDISIEIIFFSQTDSDNHKLIHNRRILTNTYVLDAPYKLAALLSNGTVRESQTISIRPLFELIHMDKDSDMKEKMLRFDLKRFYNYIDNQCNAIAQTGMLYRNGVLVDSISKIQHRFLCKKR